MSQLDDLQAFTNFEMPRRGVMLPTSLADGYDDDPNDAGAPDILKDAPIGARYLQATGPREWVKLQAGAATWTEVEANVAEARTLYVGKHGADTEEGLNIGYPFLTIGAAITAATALTPTAANPVVIRIHDAGIYAETIILPDFVSLIGPAATVEYTLPASADVISAGEGCYVQLKRVVVSSFDSYGLVKTLGSGGTTIFHVNRVEAALSSCAAIRASTGEVYFFSEEWVTEFLGLNGVNTGSAHLTVGRILLAGNNGGGIRLTAAGDVVGKVGSIEESGSPTTTTGIQTYAGSLVALMVDTVEADTAINVPVGSTLNLTASRLVGTRTVAGTANLQVAGEGGIGLVPDTRQIINGTGILGGGDLSADRTLSVDQSALDPANMDSGVATLGQAPLANGSGGIAWGDATAGFVPDSRQIINGTGISGGGDLSADRTLSVDQSALDPANMDSGAATLGQAPLANGSGGIAWGDASAGLVPDSRQIINGTGISGGGDLSADRTLSVDQTALDPANMDSGSATLGQAPLANGSGGIAWGDVSGGVAGPVSSTDNALTRWDGTDGGTVQNSGITISDADAMVFPSSGSISKPSTGFGSEAFGSGSLAGAASSVAFGPNASIPVPSSGASTGAIAIGSGAQVGDGTSGVDSSIAIGLNSRANSGASHSVAIGSNAEVGTGIRSIALGYDANAFAVRSIAVGERSVANSSGGVALGGLSKIYTVSSGDSDGAIALGKSATIGSATPGAGCNAAIAIGENALVNAGHLNAVAIGVSAASTASNRVTFASALEVEMGQGLGVWGVTPPASQPVKVNDPSGGTTIDTEARTAINAIIDILEGAGFSSAT